MKERKPTMQDSLRVIAEAGVEVEVVLDVGVLTVIIIMSIQQFTWLRGIMASLQKSIN